jgi:hypothetical protein
MEREKAFTPEETISRILGLPLERIAFMKQEYHMPITYPEFSEWFVENPEIILEELRQNFEASLFPRELRPELAEPAA